MPKEDLKKLKKPREFKGEYTDKNGNIQSKNYVVTHQTQNDKLSENIEETIKIWKKESIAPPVTKDYEETLKPGQFIRYIATIGNTGKKLMARKGGVVMKFDNKGNGTWVQLKNPLNNKAWPVQLNRLKMAFIIRNPGDPVSKLEKSQEKQEKKNKAEIRKEKQQIAEEEKEVEKQEKQELKEKKQTKRQQALEKKEKAKAVQKAIEEAEKKAEEKAQDLEKDKNKPLSLNNAHKELENYYYKLGNTFGRDKLFKSINIYLNDKYKTEKVPYIARRTVEKWLKSQELYQLTKPSKRQSDFQVVQSKEPYKVMQMDLLELGAKPWVILNIIDAFSRYAWSRVLPNKTAESVINGLKDIAKDKLFKYPSLLTSDNGPEFVNKKMEEYLKSKSIKHITTLPHHPEANGKVERLNGTLKRMYKKIETSAKNPDIDQEMIEGIAESYNNSYHRIIKTTPRKALKPENQEEVQKTQDKIKSFEQHNIDDLRPADIVRIGLKGEDKDAQDFRTNWSEALFQIKTIRRPRKDPSRPIQYKVEYLDPTLREIAEKQKQALKDKKIKDIAESRGVYTRNELQLIAPISEITNKKGNIIKSRLNKYIQGKERVHLKYVVDRVVKRFKKNGKEYATVKFKGFRSTPENNATKLVSQWKKEGVKIE